MLKENWSFERWPDSGKNKKFDSEIYKKIFDLVSENKFISIKEITSIQMNGFTTTPSYGTIDNIKKENGYSYVSPRLTQKTDEEIKINKRGKWCKKSE